MKVETGKKTLILHGRKTSNVVNSVLSDLYHLKKDSAVKFSRRNEDISPFESGGDTSLEFFSQKTDCSIFVVSTKPTQIFASPTIYMYYASVFYFELWGIIPF